MACTQSEAPRTPTSSKQNDTIAISICGQETPIMLPRNHEIVRNLQQYIPASSTASSTASYSPRSDASSSDKEAISALQTLSAKPSSDLTSTTRRRRRRGVNGSGKKCKVDDCDKISVSRGLCRGHGGGRRCQHPQCSKGAQSRSDFCWAHGGGQRCEVPHCMRSRKSKRFCVAHLSWESQTPYSTTNASRYPLSTSSPQFSQLSSAMGNAMFPSSSSFTSSTQVSLAPLVPGSIPTPPTQQTCWTEPRAILPKLDISDHASNRLPSLQQALRKNQCAESEKSMQSSSSIYASGMHIY